MRTTTLALAIAALTACGGVKDYDTVLVDTGDDGDDFGDTDTNDTVDTSPDTSDTNDTQDTNDTDDTDDSDTQDTSPAASAPNLVSFDARESGSMIEIGFRVTDADNDLVGGVVNLSIDGTATPLSIPNDIDFWNPSGESKILLPANGCDSASHSYSATVRDASGLTSGSMSDSLALSTAGLSAPEVGDTDYDIWDAGVVSLPTTICATMHTSSNDGVSSYDGDIDFFAVEFNASGYVTFDLTWDSPTGDYDIHLYDGNGDFIKSSIQDGTTQPESVTQSVFNGEVFYVMVAGWAGGSGGYQLSLH